MSCRTRLCLNIFREGGTPASWIAVLDRVEKLGAVHVLPDHSAIGDGSLVAQEKAFIVDLTKAGARTQKPGHR